MEGKKSELNPELFGMMKRGQLSPAKVISLIKLKEIVDRFSTRPFLEESKLQEIVEKTGVEPDILTWGDYFQTEIGSRYFDRNDPEFEQIIETVRFDLISAHLIFSEKPDYFKDKVRGDALGVKAMEYSFWGIEEEEKIQLEILLDYYENMGIGEKPLAISDRVWYESFDLKQAVI